MSTKAQRIQHLIEQELPESITAEYQTDDRLRENENSVLGVAISQWAEWDGIRITEVVVEALDDANFHGQADINRDLLTLLQRDDLQPYENAIEAIQRMLEKAINS